MRAWGIHKHFVLLCSMKSASHIICFDLMSFVLKSGIRPHLMHGAYLAIAQQCGLWSEDPKPDPNLPVNKQPTLSESIQTRANFQPRKWMGTFLYYTVNCSP